MSMLQRAIEIALKAHNNQTDKAGLPYLLHVFQVMSRGKNEDEKITALLHDVLEDSNMTFEQLLAEGFPPRILAAVRCLTRNEGESYEAFIERVKSNSLATRVKLCDLEDNMDIRRLSSLSEKDMDRLNKYLKAYRHLLD